jgi:hypothetical protein
MSLDTNEIGDQLTDKTTRPVNATPAYVASQNPEFLDARGVEARFSIRRSLLYELYNGADSGTIRDGLYLGTGGTVKFASGKTGDIVLYCSLASLDFAPSILGLLYYDDSSAAGNHVTVQLIKMAMDTGAITTIVTVDSDTGPVSSQGKANHTVHDFRDQYDPKNFAYYLRIDIIRNSPTANETVYGVALQTL